MNFIGLYICFKALNPHIAYDEFQFDNYFQKKYIRVSEVSKVIQNVTFKVHRPYYNDKIPALTCKVLLNSGKVVFINQECDLVVEELNK